VQHNLEKAVKFVADVTSPVFWSFELHVSSFVAVATTAWLTCYDTNTLPIDEQHWEHIVIRPFFTVINATVSLWTPDCCVNDHFTLSDAATVRHPCIFCLLLVITFIRCPRQAARFMLRNKLIHALKMLLEICSVIHNPISNSFSRKGFYKILT
jgi:hypothetical protein